jgi:hypothetical protein
MARGGGTRALSEAPREGYAQGGGRVAHLGSRAAIADIAAEPLPGNRQQFAFSLFRPPRSLLLQL